METQQFMISRARLLFLSILLFSTSLKSTAQFRSDFDQSNFYLDLSSGIDNHTGLLGFGILYPYSEKASFRGGIGLGAWGLKTSAGIKFQNLETQKWGLGISASFCPGSNEANFDFNSRSGNTIKVSMLTKPVGSLNLTVNRSWKFSSNMIFFMESGYAIPLSSIKPIVIKDPDDVLTPQDEADVMTIMNIAKPGGLILALGFQIGF